MAEISKEEWQSLEVRKKYKHLLDTGHLVDCSFLVGSDESDLKKFPCHKWILICAPPVFERMFQGGFRESKASDEIRLTDVEPVYFEKFLSFLYYYDEEQLKNFSVETLRNLVYLSNKYDVSTLLEKSINQITLELKFCGYEDLIDNFEFAHKIDNEGLLGAVSEAIQNRIKSTKRVENLVAFTHIYELDYYIFLDLLNVLQGVLSEVIRFKMVELYAKINNLTGEKDSTFTTFGKHDGISVARAKLGGKEVEGGSAVALAVDPNKTSEVVPNVEAHVKDFVVNGGPGAALVVDPIKDSEIVANIETKKEIKDQKNMMLRELLGTINFGKMSLKSFCNGANKSDILDFKQKYNILVDLCLKLPNNVDD